MYTEEIRTMGYYIEADENDVLLLPEDRFSVHPTCEKLLNEMSVIIDDVLGNDLLSIYVRGSMIHGEDVSLISDVDLYCIVSDGSMDEEWIANIQDRYEGDLPLDINVFEYSFIKKEHVQRELHLFCMLWCGIEVMSYNGITRIGDMYGYIYNYDYDYALKTLGENGTGKMFRKYTKLIIRVAHELVMEREQRYTNSLYYCLEGFSKYYPERSEDLRNILLMFLNPPNTVAEFKQVCGDFPYWLHVQMSPIVERLATENKEIGNA